MKKALHAKPFRLQMPGYQKFFSYNSGGFCFYFW